MFRRQFLATLVFSFTVGLVVGCSPTGGGTNTNTNTNTNSNSNTDTNSNNNGAGQQVPTEVFYPSSSGGNLAAMIRSNNQVLHVLADHDGGGRVSTLLGFEYLDSPGGFLQMIFGSSPSANSRTMQGFSESSYVDIDGFLMQIDADADGSVDVRYYDSDTGAAGEVKNLASAITSCQSYLEQAGSFTSDSGVEHTMAESVCFIKDALLCISAIGGATGVEGLAGQTADILNNAQDFVTISCEEVGSWLENRDEALDEFVVDIQAWIDSFVQQINEAVEEAVGGANGCDRTFQANGWGVDPPASSDFTLTRENVCQCCACYWVWKSTTGSARLTVAQSFTGWGFVSPSSLEGVLAELRTSELVLEIHYDGWITLDSGDSAYLLETTSLDIDEAQVHYLDVFVEGQSVYRLNGGAPPQQWSVAGDLLRAAILSFCEED